MSIAYSLTPELRIKLKKPIGTLIRGSFAETMKILKDKIEREKPVAIISVGDTVSRNLAENHVSPHLAIVDNKVMRKKVQPVSLVVEKTVYVRNPQGTITEEALKAIRESFKDDCRVKMVVDGEEDLLALIAVFFAPKNSFVVYGQPHEGIVVVQVTAEKKEEIAQILKAMEITRKAK